MPDLMTEKAAELFNVPPEEVTKEQRNLAKKWYHAENYNVGGIKAGLIVGQYPVMVKH